MTEIPVWFLSDDWDHLYRKEHRGGYGYVRLYPCKLMSVKGDRKQIALWKPDGTMVLRWVKGENVTSRWSNK